MKNKVWLGSFCSLVIGFVYSMLALFEVFPEVTQSLVLQLMNQVLTFLGLIGVIVDPTTAGLGDSERALGYDGPLGTGQPGPSGRWAGFPRPRGPTRPRGPKINCTKTVKQV